VTKTSSPTVNASLRYSGRLATDTLGVMTQTETDVATGAAAETSGRWGDYYQMAVDPSDDCTFWFVGMYRPTGSWATRAANFKFSSCGGTPVLTYSVSGAVTTSAGAAVSGVTLSTGSASASSDSTGAYSIANLTNGSYTVTPSKSGCSFSPANRAVTVSSANVTAQNFTATCTTSVPVERLLNGGFDTITTSTNTAADGSWTRSAFTGTSFNTLVAGSGSSQAGGSNALLGLNNSSSQTVDSAATPISAAATTATLSFYTSITTSETTTSVAYDKLFVELVDASNNTVLTTLATLSNLNKTASATTYVQRSFNVLAYKGKNVKVRLRATMDSSITSSFRVDTVSLIAD
jgi:Carboxypeptidase regulatory-like domain